MHGGVTQVQAPTYWLFFFFFAHLLVRGIDNVQGYPYSVYGNLAQLFLRKDKGVKVRAGVASQPASNLKTPLLLKKILRTPLAWFKHPPPPPPPGSIKKFG